LLRHFGRFFLRRVFDVAGFETGAEFAVVD
jgi:hypothetical protein